LFLVSQHKYQNRLKQAIFARKYVLPSGIKCLNYWRNDIGMLKNRVKEWRDKRDIKKAHLARQIGVCRSYVSKLEQQDLQPSGEMMFRIAEYFKARVEDIFYREGEEDCKRLFFTVKSLPSGNRVSKLHTGPGQAVVQLPGHSARPSSGIGGNKGQRSLVGPTAKGVASPVARLSHRKIK